MENGKVLFYLYSLKEIPHGAEITIPFDFNYQDWWVKIDFLKKNKISLNSLVWFTTK